MGGTGPCDSIMIILGNHVYSYNPKYQIWCESDVLCAQEPQYTGLVYMRGTRSCGPMRITFSRITFSSLILSNSVRIECSMCPRPQYTGLVYMGATRSCGPMRIILGSVVYSEHAIPNIKFGTNRTFYVPKTPIYRFYCYGRYRTL